MDISLRIYLIYAPDDDATRPRMPSAKGKRQYGRIFNQVEQRVTGETVSGYPNLNGKSGNSFEHFL
ncbi:hypothetical protein [Ferribacterium limneticum]|uniref:hypothetical protein n=1 Tax=Ferribacterium limneticum TaxID=76259 RepID=UPI001CF81776|nr:hypothetical protein [Ferribacterium limneticum]UCV24638.1 hypothetical protein KI613_09100 [Ferribacterium limneticum]